MIDTSKEKDDLKKICLQAIYDIGYELWDFNHEMEIIRKKPGDLYALFSDKSFQERGAFYSNGINRVEYEIDLMTKMHPFYFLIARECIKNLREKVDIFFLGSRGSYTSSFVSYLLGLQEINPLEINYIRPEVFFGISEVYKKRKLQFHWDLPEKIFRLSLICFNQALKNKGCITDNEELENICLSSKIGRVVIRLRIAPESENRMQITSREEDETTIITIHNNIGTLEQQKYDECEYSFSSRTSVNIIDELANITEENPPDCLTMDALVQHTSLNKIFQHCKVGSCISAIGNKYVATYIAPIAIAGKINNLEIISRIIGLAHGTDVLHGNIVHVLLQQGHISLQEVFCFRDDLIRFAEKNSCSLNVAYELMYSVSTGGVIPKKIRDFLSNQKQVEPWLLQSLDKIRFLFPASHCLEYAYTDMLLYYYWSNYPEVYNLVKKRYVKEIG